MSTNAALIFLACNYSNKKVKVHFNKLKANFEAALPVRVVLIDKERGKGSRDLWKEIQTAITDCALAVFDVSAFRPNVVLELGYALAVKDEEQIIITFDERKLRGNKPQWLLSDISHLHQVRYRTLEQMDSKIEENLSKVPSVARYRALQDQARAETLAGDKYVQAALSVLHALREKNGLTDQQLDAIVRGTNVRRETFLRFLKSHQLAYRERGRGRWYLVEE